MFRFIKIFRSRAFSLIAKLKIRSLPWTPGIVLLSAATIVLIFYFSSRIQKQYKQDIEKELQTILKTTQGALRLWQRDHQSDQEAISKNPRVVHVIQQAVNESGASLNNESLKQLEELFLPWLNIQGYRKFNVYIKDHENRIAPLIGNSPEHQELFSRTSELVKDAFNDNFKAGDPIIPSNASVILPHQKHQVLIQTLSPVKNNEGEIIAVISFISDAFDAFTSITQLGRIGETGETYLVSKTGKMITRSRFVEGTYEHSKVDVPGSPELNTLHALLSQSENLRGSVFDVEGYNDYRGVQVVGASLWDDQLRLGIVSEVDKSEAYLSYRLTRSLVWIIILIILIGMTIVMIFRETRSRNLSKIYTLERSAEVRKELLAIVSHDLKNPLSSLLMTNELLLKTLPADIEFSERRKKLLELSRNAAEQMRMLITDLLDSAKIEAGKLEIFPEDHSVTEIIENVLLVIEPIAKRKSISIMKQIESGLPHLWVDPHRTTQIFSNLLGNAIKFTEKGGVITVTARQTKKHIEFSISDTGAGISKDDLEHLFERYWQAQKTRSLGTGLGLSICKELITAHGGTIWAESEPGKGTTFHFSLPVMELNTSK